VVVSAATGTTATYVQQSTLALGADPDESDEWDLDAAMVAKMNAMTDAAEQAHNIQEAGESKRARVA